MLITIPPGDRILKIAEVARRVGLAQSTLEQHIRAGKFPQPLKLTTGKRPRIGWLASTVDAHVARLAAQAVTATAAKSAPGGSAPQGRLEMAYDREDRAAVTVRRLSRFGFRSTVEPRGDKYAVLIQLERGDVGHTLDMLRCCVPDVMRTSPPAFVETGGQPAESDEQVAA